MAPEENNEQPGGQPAEPTPPAQPAAPQGAPQYQAPPPGYQAPPPGYQAPPPGDYQAPPPGGYQQPGYQQPVADPVGNLQLNYWLSVFFVWIPALIFWLIEKDKGDQRATAFHVSNLNFSLLRTGVYIVTGIVAVIPYLNLILVPLCWIASLVLFIFHIMAAAKAANEYRGGGKTDPFIFNIPLVK